MAIKKSAGALEDLTFGMGTETQLRKGKEVVVTQVNATNIPYTSTTSIYDTIEQLSDVWESDNRLLFLHITNYDNPHQVTPDDVGAAPLHHTHPVSDVDDLQDDLDDKAPTHHIHAIADVTGLQADLDLKAEIANVFDKTAYLSHSDGSADAGKPIVLNTSGRLDSSIAGSGLTFVSMFTPTSGTEYPDETGHDSGSYWTIDNVDEVLGYTFEAGDLIGITLFNGDHMILGTEGWGFRQINIDPQDYYRIDGTIAISDAFAGGGQQFKNAAAATEAGDLVEYTQYQGTVLLNGTRAMTAALDMGTNKISNLGDGSVDTDAVTIAQNNLKADSSALTAHTSNVSNPHTVTKAQIGLDFVINTGAGDLVLADNGTYVVVSASSGVPVGTIVMWNDPVIPEGWAICDGTGTTPNLIDMFVKGGATTSIGNTGGSNDAVIVAHSHSASSTGTADHTHGGTTGTEASHTHSGTTDNEGDHTHSYENYPMNSSGQSMSGSSWTINDSAPNGMTSGGDGSHDHGFSTGAGSSHSHDFTTGGAGAWTPAITVDSEGSDGAGLNQPSFYVLVYIQKV